MRPVRYKARGREVACRAQSIDPWWPGQASGLGAVLDAAAEIGHIVPVRLRRRPMHGVQGAVSSRLSLLSESSKSRSRGRRPRRRAVRTADVPMNMGSLCASRHAFPQACRRHTGALRGSMAASSPSRGAIGAGSCHGSPPDSMSQSAETWSPGIHPPARAPGPLPILALADGTHQSVFGRPV